MKDEAKAFILEAIAEQFSPFFNELADKIIERVFYRIYDMAVEEARTQHGEELDGIWQKLRNLKNDLESVDYCLTEAIDDTDDLISEIVT